MDTGKKAFVLYLDYKENLDMLTHEQKGILLDMIFEYASNGNVIEAEPIIKMAFSFIRNQLDRDMQKYQSKCERNRNNGKLGGRPKKQEDNIENPNKPNGFLENPIEPKKADTDKDTDTDKDKDIDKDTDTDKDKDIDKDTDTKKIKSSRFTPPTLKEVTSYCKERNNNIDPEQFIDHYTSNGWMRGNTKIKDWKACVRTWEKRNNQSNTVQATPGKKSIVDEVE